jgi:AcrR family transcriptional regulator
MGRHSDIIHAAFRVFAREGFHGASIRKIALEAGLKSSALIYWYFKDKDELVRAVMNHYSPMLRELPVMKAQMDSPPEEVLPRVAETFLRMLDTPDLFRVFIGNAAQLPEITPLISNIRPALDFFIAYMNRQVALGKLRPHDTQSSARAFISTLTGYALISEILTPLKDGMPERPQYIDDVVNIFLAGLRPVANDIGKTATDTMN